MRYLRGKKMRRFGLGLALTSALVVAVPAAADDPAPPFVTLHNGGERQGGEIYSSDWTTTSGPDECVTGIGDGIPRMGPALHVGTGRQRLWFRLHTAQRPKKVSILAFSAIDEGRLPSGPSRKLSNRLVKDARQGRTRWFAIARPDVASDLYLTLGAHWKDRGPCAYGLDSAYYVFHVAP